MLRWKIRSHSPVRGPVISVDLELLNSVHSLQSSKSLGRLILVNSSKGPLIKIEYLTWRGTLLDPVTNWRNFARSVWSKLLRARQNLKFRCQSKGTRHNLSSTLTRQSADWLRCTCGTPSWPSGRRCWCLAGQRGAAPAPARWRWRST